MLMALADVLACSQKVSHPEMRLVSAAIGASFHFSFRELWCMLIFCFHNLVTYAQRLCFSVAITSCFHGQALAGKVKCIKNE
jgi:hypothetical protein